VATLTRQVARPVFFSVLVILLVYVPIVTLTGVDGKMFRPMAAAVIMALLGSLVLALTFVPAAAAMLLRSRDIPAREPWLVRAAEHVYAPRCAAATRRPGWWRSRRWRRWPAGAAVLADRARRSCRSSTRATW
jgi:cobalt-zinc-cadmium resistance protein CzcA